MTQWWVLAPMSSASTVSHRQTSVIVHPRWLAACLPGACLSACLALWLHWLCMLGRAVCALLKLLPIAPLTTAPCPCPCHLPAENLCVDATRAGNLAHMLNHSCNPNCYSRTIRHGTQGRQRRAGGLCMLVCQGWAAFPCSRVWCLASHRCLPPTAAIYACLPSTLLCFHLSVLPCLSPACLQHHGG